MFKPENLNISKAVIVAAGLGMRLRPLTTDKPKCLLDVGGITILEHQLECLNNAGIYDITVVTGHQAKKIHTRIGNKVHYVHNPVYQKTSSLFSLWLLRSRINEGFVLINSDVVFYDGTLNRLLDSSFPSAICVDYNQDLGFEETKVKVRNNRVARISKALNEYDGENLGLLKFSKEDTKFMLAVAGSVISAGKVDAMVPYAVNKLAKHRPIGVVSRLEDPWTEVDYASDLRYAQEDVYPKIVKLRADRDRDNVIRLCSRRRAAGEAIDCAEALDAVHTMNLSDERKRFISRYRRRA